jgi:hypothetical protein
MSDLVKYCYQHQIKLLVDSNNYPLWAVCMSRILHFHGLWNYANRMKTWPLTTVVVAAATPSGTKLTIATTIPLANQISWDAKDN